MMREWHQWLPQAIHWAGGLAAYCTLALIFHGIYRGMQRTPGRSSGRAAWLLSPWFFWFDAALFFGIGFLGWRPLPLQVAPPARFWMAVAGALLLFPGLALAVWGRQALGRNYFVSTALGAQLFAGHELVTTGPYSWVRHPMYAGLALAAWGSLLVYWTWTSLFFAAVAPLLAGRARREEKVLAKEFGAQWQMYRRRVPAYIPCLRRGTRP